MGMPVGNRGTRPHPGGGEVYRGVRVDAGKGAGSGEGRCGDWRSRAGEEERAGVASLHSDGICCPKNVSLMQAHE